MSTNTSNTAPAAPPAPSSESLELAITGMTCAACSTRLEKVGTKSAVLLQEIVMKDSKEIAADARITFVVSDRSGRAVILEGDVLQQIENQSHCLNNEWISF